MGLRTIATMAALTTVITVTAAEARVFGSRDTLEFVDYTSMLGEGSAPLSLCHVTSDQYIMFFPVYTTSLGYALAENECDANKYTLLGEDDLATEMAAGRLPSTLPPAPELSGGTVMKNNIVKAVLALIVLVGGGYFARRKYREVMG